MVALSWISFLIPPNCFPGRMSLLVTLVLCIINVMTSEMQQSPEGSGWHALDCWYIICLVMVGIASFEYAILLYFMRFGKVPIQSAKVRNVQGANKENHFETNSFFVVHANCIDHLALFLIPALFILTMLLYFVCYLYTMPNCEQNNAYKIK